MQATTISLYLFVLVALVSNFKPCVSGNKITLSSFLQDNGTTIVSAGKSFELGFFNPEDKINAERYVGIWYYNLSPRTIVWIANRDTPLLGGTGVFAIVEDGNLKLLDENGSSYFHTNLESSSYPNRTLKLLDSGNLALIDGRSGNYLWQSFEEPTDTFLPGMKMDENSKLVSWMDPGDPKTGNYTFQQNQEDNTVYMIMERTILYWRSGGSGELENIVTFMLSNFSRGDKPATDISSNKIGSINYGRLRNASIFNYSNTRLVMNSSGEIQFYRQQQHGWSLIWSEPHDACAINDRCGIFGVCNLKNKDLACECLPGFAAVYPDRWKDGDFTGGCERKSAICNKTSKPDIFLNLKFMKVGKPDLYYAEAKSEEQCRDECFNNCQTKCQAYYYAGTNSNRRRLSNRNAEPKCWIWTSDPNNLQEYYDGGHNLSIRVAVAAIGSTSRDCESCGKFIIPYPLSTGPSCGDPSYYSFSCNDSTGQLFFSTMSNSYEVIDINKEEQRFVILVNRRGGAENCGARISVESLQLNLSLPFNVTNWCYNKILPFSYERSIQGEQRIEISWKSPLEPICHSSNDCEDWPHSNCSASKRCLCNPNYHWDNLALMCKSADALSTSPNFAKPSMSMNHEAIIIVTTVIAVVLVAGSFSCFLYRRRILAKMQERKGSTTGNPVPPMDDSEEKSNEMLVEDDKIVDVPYFSLESILAATDNFSDANKLGQGGFGPVYKGIFPGEKEIAIKRLSSHSGQGMVEFRNEVVLIAKLQHRNLVRLLGYCIKGSEKILLYEYMPNKSLDNFIFDQDRCRLLDWNRRFDIILGIARGLLYLHQDSRLRIIHRDLKTSNILLDEEMSPKISDFGLARIVEGRETEANTMTIVGTYGYMSPEYAIEGLFSTKSDVFSFGVILLEIISGKRNTGYYQSKEALSLLGYAWKLWQGRNAMDLIDTKILESCNGTEVVKCINIGLLCVEEDPSNRPTMSNVITMLTSETATLPSPNQPAFVVRRRTSGTSTSLTSKEETKSTNEMTISVEEGR